MPEILILLKTNSSVNLLCRAFAIERIRSRGKNRRRNRTIFARWYISVRWKGLHSSKINATRANPYWNVINTSIEILKEQLLAFVRRVYILEEKSRVAAAVHQLFDRLRSTIVDFRTGRRKGGRTNAIIVNLDFYFVNRSFTAAEESRVLHNTGDFVHFKTVLYGSY